MEEIKISVVMSCYNSERFLHESIDSILMQTYKNFEFIIWNDGSTDSTEEIIKSYHDNRIRYFCASNQGTGAARAAACKEARGKYIACMDDDDIAMPFRLEKELSFLESHSDYILVSCLCEFITEEGKVIGQSIQPCTDRSLKKRCNINHSGAMFRKDAYFRAGGYLNIRTGQDFVLWGRMSRYGKYANLPETLVKYRIQPNSIVRKLRDKNYNICLDALRQKIISDEIVDTHDLALLNDIWKSNVEVSKKLPPYKPTYVVNGIQQGIVDIFSCIIGKRFIIRVLCFVKGWVITRI
jgi:glycosyltransferase involved in cell wall biosynthesis